jgi:VanZ family protein
MRSKRNACQHIAILVLGLYWSVLFAGTHMPSSMVDVHLPHDKILHFTAFVGLSFLLAWSQAVSRPRWSTVRTTLLVVIAYAAVDELTQLCVPGRSSDLLDWSADIAGALMGLAAYWVSWPLLNMAGIAWLRGSSAAPSK